MYESFYLRAVSPSEPVGVWIRHTVHKAPGLCAARLGLVHGLRRAARAPVHAQAHAASALDVPAGGWIAIGESARIGPGVAQGSCGEASWSLRFSSAEPELMHLSPGLAIPLAAATHEADEPGARGELRRRARAGGRADARAGGLAGDGRSQLGRRARRALDLAARDRLRGAARTRGSTWRSVACKLGGTDDAVGGQRRAHASTGGATASAVWGARAERARERARDAS